MNETTKIIILYFVSKRAKIAFVVHSRLTLNQLINGLMGARW